MSLDGCLLKGFSLRGGTQPGLESKADGCRGEAEFALRSAHCPLLPACPGSSLTSGWSEGRKRGGGWNQPMVEFVLECAHWAPVQKGQK